MDTSRNAHSDTALDLAAVLKTSQAISSEIELDQLLSSLMQVFIENTGAQAGCLILESSGEWMIEASSELHQGETICTTQVRSINSDRKSRTGVNYSVCPSDS